MIVTLSSTHPEFFFLIGKNPAGLPIMRSLRNGTITGWFHESRYVVYFHDSLETCSFQSGHGSEAKYVNAGQYNSPAIITGILSEIFSSALRRQDDRDAVANQTLSISGLKISNLKLYDMLRDTFTEVKFNRQHIVGSTYEIELTSHSTLFDFMNMVSLFAVIMTLGNKESINMDDGAIEKYLKHLDRATTGKVPNDGWYLRYVFKKRVKLNARQLALLNTPRIKMSSGNTSDARTDFVSRHINYDQDFLDVGCGTDLPSMRLVKRKWDKQNLSEYSYYLVDADPKIGEKLTNQGLVCYDSVDAFYQQCSDFNGCVIMTEVIEHNEEIDAATLIHSVLSRNPAQVLITTPNYDFNQFFNNAGRYRHDDHRWELPFGEFQTWLNEIAKDYPYDIVFEGVGDRIDDIAITSGVILTHK